MNRKYEYATDKIYNLVGNEGYNVFRHTPYQAVYDREYGKP